MREIKFRGKRVDNSEWIYGSLIQSDTSYKYGYNGIMSNCWIKQENVDVGIAYFVKGSEIRPECFIIQVEPETVGQYTGLQDKNKAKIYEGDVIRSFDSKGKEIKHLVSYDEERACFTADFMEYSPGCGIYQHWIDKFKKEIIGNIHQNPELLEPEPPKE